MTDPNRPPAVALRPDGLPKAKDHPLGPAFISSTPPMPSQDLGKEVWGLYGNISSPPTTATSSTFGINHPAIPHDPFASTLDLSSNRGMLDSPPVRPPIRASLTRNSPSMQNLKNFLAPKSQLTKAKSFANIREKTTEPNSAPPQKTAVRQSTNAGRQITKEGQVSGRSFVSCKFANGRYKRERISPSIAPTAIDSDANGIAAAVSSSSTILRVCTKPEQSADHS